MHHILGGDLLSTGHTYETSADDRSHCARCLWLGSLRLGLGFRFCQRRSLGFGDNVDIMAKSAVLCSIAFSSTLGLPHARDCAWIPLVTAAFATRFFASAFLALSFAFAFAFANCSCSGIQRWGIFTGLSYSTSCFRLRLWLCFPIWTSPQCCVYGVGVGIFICLRQQLQQPSPQIWEKSLLRVWQLILDVLDVSFQSSASLEAMEQPFPKLSLVWPIICRHT